MGSAITFSAGSGQKRSQNQIWCIMALKVLDLVVTILISLFSLESTHQT